jgi:hypothetical protein
MWKNTEERDRPQMTIRHMRSVCWIPKATNTHTVCVILITFPMQQWLQECASVLRYAYIAWLVAFNYGLFLKTQSMAHTIGL